MKRFFFYHLVCFVLLVPGYAADRETMVLPVKKDTFGRSNERTRNNGASKELFIAHAPGVRSLVAFDLSGVTNTVLSATLRFQAGSANDAPVALTIAPMASTEKNAAWIEGQGALGTTGQNARPGESCYGWSAFPEVFWESASGAAATDLGDGKLWGPAIISQKRSGWEAGRWIEITITDLRLLEEIRTSKQPVLTLGIWGTSGNGLYAIRSKESGQGPELVLGIRSDEGGI